MKGLFQIWKEIHGIFLQARVSTNVFKKYMERDASSDPNLPFKKAGYKIYGVEILREGKSRMDPFKKTALSPEGESTVFTFPRRMRNR